MYILANTMYHVITNTWLPSPVIRTTVCTLVACMPTLFWLVPMQEILPPQSWVVTLSSVSILVTVKGGCREAWVWVCLVATAATPSTSNSMLTSGNPEAVHVSVTMLPSWYKGWKPVKETVGGTVGMKKGKEEIVWNWWHTYIYTYSLKDMH